MKRRAALTALVTALTLSPGALADNSKHLQPLGAGLEMAQSPVQVVPRGKFLRSVSIARRQRHLADRLRAQLVKERRRDAGRGYASSVREAISIASIVYGVPTAEMTSVARCESNLDPLARNAAPIYNGEHATGLLQTIPSTFARSPFRHLSIYSPYANALAAGYIWSLSHSWREWACRP